MAKSRKYHLALPTPDFRVRGKRRNSGEAMSCLADEVFSLPRSSIVKCLSEVLDVQNVP